MAEYEELVVRREQIEAELRDARKTEKEREELRNEWEHIEARLGEIQRKGKAR
jgi:chaperonin cofactor prefoldin